MISPCVWWRRAPSVCAEQSRQRHLFPYLAVNSVGNNLSREEPSIPTVLSFFFLFFYELYNVGLCNKNRTLPNLQEDSIM